MDGVGYRNTRSYENLERRIFSGVGSYGIGCMNSKARKDLFLSGYAEMVKRLHPEKIIFYGHIPPECTGNIVRIRSFQDKFKEVLCDGG